MPDIESREEFSRERVTCIDTELTKSERDLLAFGPRFVVSKERFTKRQLRDLESRIETTAYHIRRQAALSDECTKREEAITTVDSQDSDSEGETPTILSDPKIRGLAVRSNCQVRQPSRADPDCEMKIGALKSTVLQAYKEYRSVKTNVSKESCLAIESLKKKDVVIKCLDKSKSLVVMSTNTYHEKVMVILSDTTNYEISDMTSEALEARVTEHLKSSAESSAGDPTRCLPRSISTKHPST